VLQTSWSAVHETLALLYTSDSERFSFSDLERLAALFPLGISLGRPGDEVASFAEYQARRAAAALDAAAVATAATAAEGDLQQAQPVASAGAAGSAAWPERQPAVEALDVFVAATSGVCAGNAAASRAGPVVATGAHNTSAALDLGGGHSEVDGAGQTCEGGSGQPSAGDRRVSTSARTTGEGKGCASGREAGVAMVPMAASEGGGCLLALRGQQHAVGEGPSGLRVSTAPDKVIQAKAAVGCTAEASADIRTHHEGPAGPKSWAEGVVVPHGTQEGRAADCSPEALLIRVHDPLRHLQPAVASRSKKAPMHAASLAPSACEPSKKARRARVRKEELPIAASHDSLGVHSLDASAPAQSERSSRRGGCKDGGAAASEDLRGPQPHEALACAPARQVRQRRSKTVSAASAELCHGPQHLRPSEVPAGSQSKTSQCKRLHQEPPATPSRAVPGESGPQGAYVAAEQPDRVEALKAAAAKPISGSLAARREALFRRCTAQAVALLQMSWLFSKAQAVGNGVCSGWRARGALKDTLEELWPPQCTQHDVVIGEAPCLRPAAANPVADRAAELGMRDNDNQDCGRISIKGAASFQLRTANVPDEGSPGVGVSGVRDHERGAAETCRGGLQGLGHSRTGASGQPEVQDAHHGRPRARRRPHGQQRRAADNFARIAHDDVAVIHNGSCRQSPPGNAETAAHGSPKCDSHGSPKWDSQFSGSRVRGIESSQEKDKDLQGCKASVGRPCLRGGTQKELASTGPLEDFATTALTACTDTQEPYHHGMSVGADDDAEDGQPASARGRKGGGSAKSFYSGEAEHVACGLLQACASWQSSFPISSLTIKEVVNAAQALFGRWSSQIDGERLLCFLVLFLVFVVHSLHVNTVQQVLGQRVERGQ
jgi:hypothetical protein